MASKFEVNTLASWIGSLMKSALDDKKMNAVFFPETRDSAVCIMGGWKTDMPVEYEDLLYTSASDPSKILCISIVMNPGHGNVANRNFSDFVVPSFDDDTTIAVERMDNPEALAAFYQMEWERLNASATALDI